MKKVICCVVLFFAVMAQWPVQAALNVEDEVKGIRKIFQDTNNEEKRLKRVEKDLEGFSTEGASLTGYFKDETLRKIVVKYYGETGKKTDEMYIDQDRLVFVFSIDSLYDRPLGKVVKTEENRLYFKDNTLLRWIGPDKKERDVTDKENIAEGERHRKNYKLFFDGLKKPARMISAPAGGK